MVTTMAITRSSTRIVFWLVVVLFVGQFMLADGDDYEYYYEEVTASTETTATDSSTSTTPIDSTATPIDSTTTSPTTTTDTTTENVTPIPISFIQGPSVVITDASTEPIMTALPTDEDTGSSVDYSNVRNFTTTGVIGTPKVPINQRTNITWLNSTRPSPRPISSVTPLPGIVLNIYTGMYGMQSQGKNRPNDNRGGRNNFWSRNQSPLQGWYGLNGMANRRPVQPFTLPNQRRPIYRGRGPVQEYGNGYYPVMNQRPTIPRRNNQQNRGSSKLDEQASMAVYNFLLQILGQAGAAKGRSQQPSQSGSRRRV